jgi:hypothetical protein
MNHKKIVAQVLEAHNPDSILFTNTFKWRKGLQTHFTKGGSEDDALGGQTYSLIPWAVISGDIIGEIVLKEGDIGGSILISNSTHRDAHTVGDSKNPGITLEELLIRYGDSKIDGVVVIYEDRDTNRQTDWDEVHIEIVEIVNNH